MPASAVMQLLWVGDGQELHAWREGLAPQVELADGVAALDGRPYAIAGSGHGALTGLELAVRLATHRHLRPAAHLIVAGCPPLPASPPITDCSVTAFSVTGDDLEIARACDWSKVTSAGFGLRLLPSPEAWQVPGELTVLAVKEELRVWPA